MSGLRSLKRVWSGRGLDGRGLDLKFDFEQTGVNMVVDMEIARRAAVYVVP